MNPFKFDSKRKEKNVKSVNWYVEFVVLVITLDSEMFAIIEIYIDVVFLDCKNLFHKIELIWNKNESIYWDTKTNNCEW